MKRATQTLNKEYTKDDMKMLREYFKEINMNIDLCSGWKNFGYINGILVITDYAIDRESGDRCSDCDKSCYLNKFNHNI